MSMPSKDSACSDDRQRAQSSLKVVEKFASGGMLKMLKREFQLFSWQSITIWSSAFPTGHVEGPTHVYSVKTDA